MAVNLIDSNDIEVTQTGSNIQLGFANLDSSVSTSSTNPVENQAITNYVDTEVAGAISNTAGTSQTKAYSQEYVNGKISDLTPVVLYDDPTGSNTTVTLNSSSANFSYLEIYFKNNDNFYSSQKVADPNGKSVCLISTFTGGVNYVIKFAGASISGTSITIDDYWEFNLNGASRIAPSNTYITKVIGYK